MKKVGKNIYFSLEEISTINKLLYEIYLKTLDILTSKEIDFKHNLVKYNKNKNCVSLLLYPNFNTSIHPFLAKSLKINLSNKEVSKIRNYKNNQPILHRLELFLNKDTPRYEKIKTITKIEQQEGLLNSEYNNKIGRINFWNSFCDKKDLKEFKVNTIINTNNFKKEFSKKTAIKRNDLSLPFKIAIKNDFFNIKDNLLDYGCGKGVDVKKLKNRGYKINGYDKFHDSIKFENIDWNNTNVITLNYVLNVIASFQSRFKLLKTIKENAKKNTKLIVSTRRENSIINYAKKSQWKNLNDGFLTKSNTFQKGFEKKELKNLLNYFFEVKKVIIKNHCLIILAKI